MTSIVEMDELGRRIRRLRAERRMTLKQVESVSGLSATHLSEIERGRTSPTIGALVRIARALEKDVSYFIETDERPDVAHLLREQVVREAPSAGASTERLTNGIPGSSLFPYWVRLEPGAGLSLPARDLSDDVIVHVQSGRVSVRPGGQTHVLADGDTIQAPLSGGLALQAEGVTAELVLVCTHGLEDLR